MKIMLNQTLKLEPNIKHGEIIHLYVSVYLIPLAIFINLGLLDIKLLDRCGMTLGTLLGFNGPRINQLKSDVVSLKQ